MSIDLTQFHQLFFDESFEGLDVMESGLLGMASGQTEVGQIDEIFRAAHTIKGGSGTLGFTEVSGFTHTMEALLDEMREGRREVSRKGIQVLLGAVDCLRIMLSALQNHHESDQGQVLLYKAKLEEELYGQTESAQAGRKASSSDIPGSLSVDQGSGWHITFRPHAQMLKLGNEPLRIFREIELLGRLMIAAGDRALPGLRELDAQQCYLCWDLNVIGQIAQDEIREIFDPVESDCDLAVQRLADWLPLKEGSDPENTLTITDAPAVLAAETEPKAVLENRKNLSATKLSRGSIRVDTDKIDRLINMVGELVITQSMLSLTGEQFEFERLSPLKEGLAKLEQHTRDLQESVLNIRMLPISFVFGRFSRLVHDLSVKLGKRIELKLSGEETEVDKRVIELISDPLMHLIRNSIDHGIEMPAQRLEMGKPETGTIHLNAFHHKGGVTIEVADDGAGLDAERLKAKAIQRGLITKDTALSKSQIFELILMPGFSMLDSANDISGRGVGMDVVRKNIQVLGGDIEISTESGRGSRFSINLPLTLAILEGQMLLVGDETYIVSLASIIESVTVDARRINYVLGKEETYHFRGEYLPIIRMHEVFDIQKPGTTKLTQGLLVVAEGQGVRCALFVDNLLGQQQFVVKSLEEHYRRIEGISGATIMADGSVALILDIPGLVRLYAASNRNPTAAA